MNIFTFREQVLICASLKSIRDLSERMADNEKLPRELRITSRASVIEFDKLIKKVSALET